ncbi:MAG TPA: hypothetical protein VFS04_13815 [Alphaproteobacteria bacterium]|nr:hypothetical protein [Alphaproteobacteria bacterium]
MALFPDISAVLLFAGAILLAFIMGRFGRKLFDRLRRGKTPAPSGPPPSRQVRRAAERQRAKRED